MPYNPYQDVYRIAVGCLYLQLHQAIVDFPGSTRGHPSEWVFVSRTPTVAVRDGDDRYFPFQVRWYLWQEVVVPILLDPAYQTNRLLAADKYTAVINHLIEGLSLRLMERGFIPSSTVPIPDGGMVVVAGSEEPIVQNPQGVDLGPYPPSDPGLTWPEGNPRLVYPVVD